MIHFLMYVQDSEQLFAQRKKTNKQTSIVHEINNDNTEKKKKKVNHNMTTLINPRVLQVAQLTSFSKVLVIHDGSMSFFWTFPQ